MQVIKLNIVKQLKQFFYEEQKKVNAKYNLEQSKKAAAKKYSLPYKTTVKKYSNPIDNSLLLEIAK